MPSRPREFHPEPLTGRVEDWRAGLGRSLYSLFLALSFASVTLSRPCHVSSPRHVERSVRISRTALSCLLHLKGYGTYRAGATFGFCSGSLALASLNRACRNLVSTFPQRSPPSLLTTAACGGLRSAPDCRPRRALLHLSYSCAPPCGPAILVTQCQTRPTNSIADRQRHQTGMNSCHRRAKYV